MKNVEKLKIKLLQNFTRNVRKCGTKNKFC